MGEGKKRLWRMREAETGRERYPDAAVAQMVGEQKWQGGRHKQGPSKTVSKRSKL